ncbi:MAG TPA: 30S ribosomal protein S19 [Candidatus Diapherotrites archaeon]|uniref:Small ribosomal subunit protein uS19 n=1 Tax=Candidatus Iainarchaeum sp. TaxID=3101447 RepID=A0A7J4JIW0_9ARCH|nr:30S ribosomal protein S19 [Candidatus Diapherotrites archaeon]HIH16549.1 30S ribosomal protein S19 [Candidatus Diapherotrites archaeon]
MAKDFNFRGIALDQLQEMDETQLGRLMTSRGRRNLRRGQDKALLKTVDRALEAKKHGKEPKPIRTHKRDAMILPKMVGLRFLVYKGKDWGQVDIVEKMIGHYLGEFALTRKRLSHGKAGIGATKSSTAITARG